jgi:hypothetical protein
MVPNDARLIDALIRLSAGGVGDFCGLKSVYREPPLVRKCSHVKNSRNQQARIHRPS